MFTWRVILSLKTQQQRPKQTQRKAPKTGGLISQLLEFFGMTPNVPSEYLSNGEAKDLEGSLQSKWLCKACHNPTEWIEAEQRWRCPHHPKASVFEEH